MKVYLDTNIYFRSMDDQSQPRINLETRAILTIFEAIEEKIINLVTSDILIFEISQSKKKDGTQITENLLRLENLHIEHSLLAIKKGKDYVNNFKVLPADAMHLAAANIGKTDYFITCDDILLKNVSFFQKELKFKGFNPVDFILFYSSLKNN